MMNDVPIGGQGWLRDLPDFRDFTLTTPAVRDALAKLKRRRGARAATTKNVDGREFLAAATDAMPLRTTSVESVLALVQYFERRATGRLVEGAPLFLYHAARLLDGIAGDNGVSLRTTLKALVRFGCPPLRYGAREVAKFAENPPPAEYGFQRDYEGLSYVRIDAVGMSGGEVLQSVKRFVSAGFACVCGCSISTTPPVDGDFAFPTAADGLIGGTSFVVTGYDDDCRIRSTRGALQVRTTWGSRGGAGGFGRLPYRFVEERMACDFWTLMKPEWSASGEFVQV